MTIHIALDNGAAKCGANVYKHYETINGKWTFVEKRVSGRYLYFDKITGQPANCRRCLNTVARPETVEISEDLTGLVFHRQFGYDMTINVFAKAIKRTAKGLLCREIKANISGDPWSPGASGKAKAGDSFADGSKPFLMLKKRSARSNYEYWTGGGETWSLVSENESFYENRCD